MKRTAYIFITILVVAVGIISYLLSRGNKAPENINTSNLNTSNNLNTNGNTNTSLGNTNIVVSAPSSATIQVTASGFSSASATVSIGGTVTWNNNSSSRIYVAPDDHPAHLKYGTSWPDTGAGNISAGQSYSFTFTKAGTYTYHDHLNPSHTGTIIVK